MKKINKFLFLLLALSLSKIAFAQASPETGIMRSNGKILVVMSVVVIIMVGLFIYLLSIDLKISRLEKGGQVK